MLAPTALDRTTRRVYVVGLRVHHGAVGVALVAVGTALIVHDRRDFPWNAREVRRA